jgi:hypothetical protein
MPRSANAAPAPTGRATTTTDAGATTAAATHAHAGRRAHLRAADPAATKTGAGGSDAT